MLAGKGEAAVSSNFSAPQRSAVQKKGGIRGKKAAHLHSRKKVHPKGGRNTVFVQEPTIIRKKIPHFWGKRKYCSKSFTPSFYADNGPGLFLNRVACLRKMSRQSKLNCSD